MERKLLQPNDIKASHVFLADFDRVTYSQVAWSDDDVNELIRNYERKVKLLLLVKGHMLIPLTHLLEGELARQVLGNEPELFSCGAVMPILPEVAKTATEFYNYQLDHLRESEAELYRGGEPEEMAALLDERAQFVSWEKESSIDWFRKRILGDLEDPQSLLRLTFSNKRLRLPAKTLRQLEKLPMLDRTDVYLAAKELKDLKRWELLSGYADFIYYLGDALTVKSEGILPQENIMDFTLSDLAGGQTKLSEYEVFTKIFVDIIKAVTNTTFPAEFLDELSIPDALDLHRIALQSDFIEKYDHIQRITKDSLAIHDAERLVLTLTELEEFEHSLHSQFEKALNRELPAHMLAKKTGSIANIFNSIGTLIIPFYGSIDTARELLISGLEVIGKEKVVKRVSSRIQTGVVAAAHWADRRDLADRPVLLSFVDQLKQRYADMMGV